MLKIGLHIQSTRSKGVVKVRYRVRDGAIQMSHTTDIKADLADLARLTADGKPKGNNKVINKELAAQLKREYQAIEDAHALMIDNGMDINSAVLEQQIAKLLKPIEAVRTENPNIVTRFKKYADSSLKADIIGENRHKHIIVVADKLDRFLKINGISGLTAQEFTIDHLMDFREFLFDEYLYVQKYKKLYEKVSERNKPKARLSMNTVTSQLKMLSTFFTELEDTDEIAKSPFRRLGKEKRKAVMKTKYDDPFFLRKEELQAIMRAKIPADLEDTRDAFLVQCAFGCRISDFSQMTMNSIGVSEEGIPYVHYLPQKTAKAQDGNAEVTTPIVRYAFDIIKRTGFEFPATRNVFGEYGFNAKIKSLLQICKIERPVAQYNEITKKNDYTPFYKIGSSKLARKTHVDLMSKVQVNKYAAGLHKVGSSAVDRYTMLELKDRFALMNAAFGQKPYKVDEELNIL